MSRARLTLLIAAFAAALGAGPARAAMEVGIQDDPVFVNQSFFNTAPNDREKAFTLARGMGARTIRLNIIWSVFVDRGRSYDSWDSTVDAALSHGIRPQFTILGTPSYVHKGSKTISYLNPSATKFGAWAKQIAEHFKGRVHRYAIWNEPNLKRYLSPQSKAPKLYHDLYSAGYAAIKSVDVSNQVLFGELTSLRTPIRSSSPRTS